MVAAGYLSFSASSTATQKLSPPFLPSQNTPIFLPSRSFTRGLVSPEIFRGSITPWGLRNTKVTFSFIYFSFSNLTLYGTSQPRVQGISQAVPHHIKSKHY